MASLCLVQGSQVLVKGNNGIESFEEVSQPKMFIRRMDVIRVKSKTHKNNIAA